MKRNELSIKSGENIQMCVINSKQSRRESEARWRRRRRKKNGKKKVKDDEGRIWMNESRTNRRSRVELMSSRPTVSRALVLSLYAPSSSSHPNWVKLGHQRSLLVLVLNSIGSCGGVKIQSDNINNFSGATTQPQLPSWIIDITASATFLSLIQLWLWMGCSALGFVSPMPQWIADDSRVSCEKRPINKNFQFFFLLLLLFIWIPCHFSSLDSQESCSQLVPGVSWCFFFVSCSNFDPRSWSVPLLLRWETKEISRLQPEWFHN